MAGASRATGGWIGQVRRLFGAGTSGGLSDGQLLDAFVSRRDGDAEAAFEALLLRHGPMVLRVCRGVLRDPHDADDAFQATFLVLANRAGAIRRRDSVASWLFGVSQRVAAQARLRAARRRSGERHVAGRTPEAYQPAELRDEPDALIEEVERLPERLRAAVVLCYLEGLTYDAAAQRLGISAGSIRGRLARARDQLRRRLTARGIELSDGFLAAGPIAANPARAAAHSIVPPSLIETTTHVALGVQAGGAAAALARQVLQSLLLGHLRSAAVVLAVVVGSGLMAWHSLAAPDGGKASAAQEPGPPRAAAPPPATVLIENGNIRSEAPCIIPGRVIVEETGEPVAGARLSVGLGFWSGGPAFLAPQDLSRTINTGADGYFRIEAPPGYATLSLDELPTGYYQVKQSPPRDLLLGREQVRFGELYKVRRGANWSFSLRREPGGPLAAAVIRFLTANPTVIAGFSGRSDASGQAVVTLPKDGRQLIGDVSSEDNDLNPCRLELEWETGFRPDAARSIAPDQGKPGRLYELTGLRPIALAMAADPRKSRRFRITDDSGKTAVIGAMAPLEPVIENGKLIIRLAASGVPVRRFSVLAGLVLDPTGQPAAGARVGLAYVRDRGRDVLLSRRKQDWTTTDAGGRYSLGPIVLPDYGVGPELAQVVASKPGFSRSASDTLTLKTFADGPPVEVLPIRLGPDVTLSGTVVDPQGQPVEGAWVSVDSADIRDEILSTRTDIAGRFSFHGLSRGTSRLNARFGEFNAGLLCPADSPAREVALKLHARPDPRAAQKAAAEPERNRPRPLASGQPAPEWQTGNWSDGQLRRLADYRGKIVHLTFWHISDVAVLPVLTRLQQQYEPRGVVFLSIHAPGEDSSAIDRVLLANTSRLVYAIDRGQGGADRARGITAERYGIPPTPSVFLIDRDGKIASSPTDPGVARKYVAIMKESGIVPNPRITEEQARVLLDKLYTSELEDLLRRAQSETARP